MLPIDTQPTDAALIAAVRAGDKRAFGRLVERHFQSVWTIAYARLRQRCAADDLAQEVFLLAFLHLKTLSEPGRFAGWLRRITQNRAVDWLRQKRQSSKLVAMVPVEALGGAPARDEEPELDQDDDHRRVRDAIFALPTEQREIVLLRFAEGLNHTEIGQRLEMHRVTVGRQLEKAMATMRTSLQSVVEDSVRGLKPSPQTMVQTAAFAAAVAGISSSSRAALVAASGPIALPAAGASFSKGVLVLATTGKVKLAMIGACLLMLGIAVTLLELKSAAPATPSTSASASDVAIPAVESAPNTAPAIASQSYYGRILTEDDKPVAGARIWRLPWYEPANHELPVTSVVTDADGRFGFPRIGSATVVFVQAEGLAFSGGMIRSRAPDDPTEIRAHQPGNLRVRFVDPDGKPAAGLHVGLAGCGESSTGWRWELFPELKPAQTRTTDAQGVCTFANIPRGGIAWLYVLDKQYAKVGFSELFTLSESETTDGGTVPLQRAASISGKVVFADSGKPAPGIKVMTTGSGQRGETITDDEGRYELQQLQTDKYCIFLFLSAEVSERCAAVAIQNVQVTPGMHLENQNFTLISGGIVRGKLTEDGSGKPLAGLGVFITGPSRPAYTYTSQDAKSNADGVYLMHVPPGAGRVQIGLPLPMGLVEPDPVSYDVNVADHETVEVDFQIPLYPALPVKGRAFDPNGHPLGNVEIYVERKRSSRNEVEAWTDAEGNFSIPAVDSTARLRARKGKWSTLDPVAPTSENMMLVLHPDALTSIHVIVQQPDGKPLAGAKVWLTAGNWQYLGDRLTNSDGSCTFRALAPDANYSVSASAAGFGIVEQDVETQPGKQSDAPPIILPIADSFVAGTVLNENGIPVADVNVMSGNSSALTDMAGHFRLDQVVPGTSVSITAKYDDRRGSVRGILAGTSDAVITIKAPASGK